ncbi:MAG TPA: multicopper oxidase domain-containing protein [Burkholderiaceae bacterium]|jgi:FtsP/CotA-like multicopper oxidase with cupredoxin domain|nr:multicopper oxidase domain-containing protein [Burkholderiaceae bacterium]
MVQCPSTTPLHPNAISNPNLAVPLSEAAEPPYQGPVPTSETVGGVPLTYVLNGGAVKCMQVSGGDGFMTEADGNQTYLFAFGPLSGMDLIKHGQPGTLFAADFNNYYNSPTLPSVCGPAAPGNCSTAGAAGISGKPGVTNPTYDPTRPVSLNGAVADAGAIMTVGVLNGNLPAPLFAIDEDDEFFLTLSNVGMIMRPDLFEQHTIHFHGYPNASSFYDGVPDPTWAINIGGSATYYYLAPDAGTYFWHCHITPPEHLQMGMVGQLYVRPRQNRLPAGTSLYTAATTWYQQDLRTACLDTGNSNGTTPPDILCSAPQPAINTGFTQAAGYQYAYNDGDGSTRYDIDVPIQIHGFDPNFHFVGMTFNPEGFADMKDKYFLLNGRSYPDTVGVPGYAGGPSVSDATAHGSPDLSSAAIGTEDSDGRTRFSQPLPTLITLDSHGGPGGTGQRALLRISDLDVTEYQTLASLGIPMTMVGFNAKLLRDQAGNNMYVTTNSITLGGGESLDVILDSTGIAPGTYFLYTPNLDHLSNDAENFGGLMTEVVVK